MQKEVSTETQRFHCYWGDDDECVTFEECTEKQAYRKMITYLCEKHEAEEFEFKFVDSYAPSQKFTFTGQRFYISGKYDVWWSRRPGQDDFIIAGRYDEPVV